VALAWIASFALAAPPLVAGNTFLDYETCAAITEPVNLTMLVYSSSALLFIPAFFITPVLLRWSSTRKGYQPASESECGGSPPDMPLRGLVICCWLVQMLCWMPFFMRLLLLLPIPPSPSSVALEGSICLLAYFCGFLTSAVVCANGCCGKNAILR